MKTLPEREDVNARWEWMEIMHGEIAMVTMSVRASRVYQIRALTDPLKIANGKIKISNAMKAITTKFE